MSSLNKRKLVACLMTLELLFLLLFYFGFVNLIHHRPIIEIGLTSTVINSIVVAFSIVSMINIVYELSKVN